MLECIRRLVKEEELGADSHRHRERLSRASANWHILALRTEQAWRAALPFPKEWVRSLDALHLAFLVRLRERTDHVALVSLDRRMRVNALALEIGVLPQGDAEEFREAWDAGGHDGESVYVEFHEGDEGVVEPTVTRVGGRLHGDPNTWGEVIYPWPKPAAREPDPRLRNPRLITPAVRAYLAGPPRRDGGPTDAA